jgi:hypothetical protein
MKRTDQARVLAEFLVPLLPNLCDASTPLAVLAADHEAVVDPTEPDVQALRGKRQAHRGHWGILAILTVSSLLLPLARAADSLGIVLSLVPNGLVERSRSAHHGGPYWAVHGGPGPRPVEWWN